MILVVRPSAKVDACTVDRKLQHVNMRLPSQVIVYAALTEDEMEFLAVDGNEHNKDARQTTMWYGSKLQRNNISKAKKAI